jgi:hypothetical protein
VERADQVLAGGGVHRRLAAHRRVDHGEEGRGGLHDGDAAQVRRGDEAGQVADHATAQSDDGGVAAVTGGEQLVGHAGPRVARLVRLARRDGDD